MIAKTKPIFNTMRLIACGARDCRGPPGLAMTFILSLWLSGYLSASALQPGGFAELGGLIRVLPRKMRPLSPEVAAVGRLGVDRASEL